MMTSKLKASIVGITEPVGLQFSSSAFSETQYQDLISYCARVSNPSNQDKFDTAEKLLVYLIKHKHWSPFEMVNVVMEINTTRDIAKQILRHRSFSFQEFSQRYADVSSLDENMFEYREARLQDEKNRQNSLETHDDYIIEKWKNTQTLVMNALTSYYKEMLNLGIAKEQARAILPEGLTKTRLYMNGTLRSWIHYCDLRRGPETQKEHREIAEDAWLLLKETFPFLETYENEFKNSSN